MKKGFFCFYGLLLNKVCLCVSKKSLGKIIFDFNKNLISTKSTKGKGSNKRERMKQ